MQLKGKQIILTGGSGGIGHILADKLRSEGAFVRIAGRSKGSDLVADLADESSLSFLTRLLRQDRVDILINLAGLIYFDDMTSQSPEHLAAMMKVNLEAPIRLTQAVIPGMLRQGGGQIVNIGSVFGALPFPHFVSYSTTKAGLKAFSDSLRREYAGKGIDVIHVAPRAVKTSMSGGAIAELHRLTKVKQDDPSLVADQIIRAIMEKRKNTVIGFPESLFVFINALFPGVIDGGLVAKRDIAEKFLKSRKTGEKSHAKAA